MSAFHFFQVGKRKSLNPFPIFLQMPTFVSKRKNRVWYASF